MTALHYAVIGNYKNVVACLILGKIDKEIETTEGFTAFEVAAKNNLVDIVSLMLQGGVGKIDEALRISRENKCKEVEKKISAYLKAVDKFFNPEILKYYSENLIIAIKQYAQDNLSKAQINLSPEFLLNAYGILSLKKQFGFFKKVTKSLAQFARENDLQDLSAALESLQNYSTRSN